MNPDVTIQILLDSSTLDTLLLDESPEERLRSVALLIHQDETTREIRRWQEVDELEDMLVRSWQDERELEELEPELGGEG